MGDSSYNEELFNELNDKIKTCERVLQERQHAACRLEEDGRWINRLNIYYSCITLLLAVLNALPNGEFLTVPTISITIIFSMMVIYASGFRNPERAADLRANCRDMEKQLIELRMYKAQYKAADEDFSFVKAVRLDTCSQKVASEQAENNEQLKLEILEDIVYSINGAIDLQKDSEEPAIVDKRDEKNVSSSGENRILCLAFLLPIILLVIVYRQEFLTLFGT